MNINDLIVKKLTEQISELSKDCAIYYSLYVKSVEENKQLKEENKILTDENEKVRIQMSELNSIDE